jgi:PHP family Zn ribbon phosphoesterase
MNFQKPKVLLESSDSHKFPRTIYSEFTNLQEQNVRFENIKVKLNTKPGFIT